MFVEVHDTDIAGRASSREIGGLLAAFAAELARSERLPDLGRLQAALRDHAARLGILAPTEDGDFLCTANGPATVATCGFDFAGRRTSDEGEAGAELARAYRRALDERRPLLLVHRASMARDVYVWERLVLPCREDDEDRILVFLKPREMRADVLEAMIEASCDGVLALRAIRGEDGGIVDGIVLAANRRAAEYVGQPVGEVLDRSVLRLVPALSRNGAWTRCARAAQDRTTEAFEIQFDADGLDTWLRVTAVPLGEGLMLSLTDITALKYALFEMEALKEEAERAQGELSTEIEARQMVEAELRRIALTDSLTGVLNRRGFDDLARQLTASARRYGHALSVIAIDLDHFKRINDLHGHAAGDSVLTSIAWLLMAEVRRETDAVSRVGGEEFMLLLPHTTAEGAGILAERLRLRIAEMPVSIGDREIRVTASFGVRELAPGGDAERMLIDADGALYEAKQRGRNCVVVWDAARTGRAGDARAGAGESRSAA